MAKIGVKSKDRLFLVALILQVPVVLFANIMKPGLCFSPPAYRVITVAVIVTYPVMAFQSSPACDSLSLDTQHSMIYE